jgi:hypothetical protein
MDATYWGRNFGVVIFKDQYTKRILWRKFVRYETLADYKEGIDWLEQHHFRIEGVVCGACFKYYPHIVFSCVNTINCGLYSAI